MRLIDGDALAEELLYDAELCAKALDSHEITDHKELARLQFEKDCKQNCVYYISEAPTVDAMPVVRCKDCANYAGDGMYCAWGLLTGDMGYCHHGYVADRAAATEETGADGERKGGNE